MTARLPGAFLAAVLVTGVIFFVMQSLVFQGRGELGKKRGRTVMEFVRVRTDTEVVTKQRERPERVKPEELPPAQDMDFDEVAPPDQAVIVVVGDLTQIRSPIEKLELGPITVLEAAMAIGRPMR